MKKMYEVLVVDDSETNLVLLEAILEDEGFNVSTAFSAKDASEKMKNGIPDLILLDLLMPNENGFDFLKKLKANVNYNQIPILIVTAFVNSENIIIAKDLGAAGVIEKPINIPEFILKINESLTLKEREV